MGEERRILVTGAGGFLGKSALRALLGEPGQTIHAVGRGEPPQGFETTVTWHRANLLQSVDVMRVFDTVRPTHLIQLAWCAEHGTYWRDHANLEWIAASLQIARAFIRNGGIRCLFAGTSAEYDWSMSGPFHEFDTPLKPHLLYGASKLATFYALSALFEQEGISWAWTRLFCPFGNNEDPRRLVPKTCIRLLSGEQLEFDSALDLRDFLHTDDIASALLGILRSEVQGPVNVASGRAVSVRDVITTLARHLGREDRVSFEDLRTDSHQKPSSITADITRLRESVAWEPEFSLDERLKQVCSWWSSQPAKPNF